MKVNFIIPIILAILLGFLCSFFVFDNYKETKTAFSEEKQAYFLQYGVYRDKSVLKSATKDLDSKLVLTINNLNYVYVGITLNEENALKIKQIYKHENIDLFIKEISISNLELIENIKQFDKLIKSSSNYRQINSVLKVVISTYEEIIIGNNL